MAETIVGKAPIKESVPGFRPMFDSTVSHSDHVTTNKDQWQLEAPLRYCHLPAEEQSVVDSVLRGWCPLANLPKINPRIVRVFISSTFTDMMNERNRLMECIYPKLKAYCRERYGVEFQCLDMRWGIPSEVDLQEEANKQHDGRIVDMRWGVPVDAWKSHATTELCLKEIRNCAEHSLGPHFVVFLGQRYGGRNLPAIIAMNEYEAIRKALRDNGTDVTLLDQWYLKDSNYQPPLYILQPVDLILGEDHSPWEEIRGKLDEQLGEGAKKCVDQGQLEQIVLDRLQASVTALEVMEAMGALSTQEEKDKNCLAFMRTITDLDTKLDRKKSASYIDQNVMSQRVNKVCAKAVETLKRKVLKKNLSPDNVYEGSIQWIDPNGVDPAGHKTYLEDLCCTFYEKTRSLIDMNVKLSEQTEKDDMYDDVLNHWFTTKEKCEKFMGREDVLGRIKEYLLGIAEEPLVLYGDSGHGKTSIMAKAASCVQQWLLEDRRNLQTTVAVRYCGTSAESSNIRALLPSLCHQVAYTTDRFRHLVPNSYKHVKKYFLELVGQGEIRGLVVIFLDALDQLSPNDGAHKLDWLPAKMAKNVKIVVSTLPEAILDQLRGKITKEERYVRVDPLCPTSCAEILDCWLKNAGKMLQFRQWQVVREAFSHCSLPLFVRLTYEEVLTWHSYQEAEQLALNWCVNDSINALFDRLEARYGKILVSHALAYLTASGGVSESEMDDILSLDDEVLSSVFTFWEPPIRRTPPTLWQRIRSDISSYLIVREDSDMDVQFWYHRQFIEAATARYLSQPAMCKYIHGTIADYLLGTWSQMRKKPFKYGPLLRMRLMKESEDGEAVRYVPEQPLVFTTFNTSKRYNLRKLNHLPYQLAKAERYDELKLEVYFNYDWIRTKLSACTVQNVIADYNLLDEPETNLIGDALRMCESALSMDHGILGLELAGRLLPHAPKYRQIRSLIRQCDIASVTTCGLVPNWQTYACPGGPLQYFCEAEASINTSIDVTTIESPDRVLLTAKPFYSNRMRMWDITQGEPRMDMKLPPGSSVYPTRDGRFIVLFNKSRSLQIFRVESGEMYGDVPYGNGQMQQVSVGNKYAAFTLKQATGPCVVDVEARSLIHRFNYQSDAVVVSSDDRYLLCSSGQLIAFHEFPLLERKCLIQAPDLPVKLVFHRKDSRRFIAMFKNNEVRAYRMDLVHKTNKSHGVLHDTDMRDFRLSHTGELLLVRALRCLFVFSIDESNFQPKLRYRISKMPSGVFQEKLASFKEAGFAPQDELLVAARHTYLGVWEARTGEPLRLLQTTVSPILNLFTSPIANKVITVLQDNSIQVWNLDNLYEEVNHCNLIVKGAVHSLEISSRGSRVVACGTQYAEARIVDLDTGKIERNLAHSDEHGRTLLGVRMSPQGRYCVTQAENRDVEEFQQPWSLLTEDKLWDAATGAAVYSLTRSRLVVFSEEDEKVVFFRCRHYSLYDFTVNCYDALCYHTITRKEETIELPEGELVGTPVIVDQGRYLALLIQTYGACVNGADGRKRSRTPGSVHGTQVNPEGHVALYVYSFEGTWHGLRQVELHELWSGVHATDRYLNIRSMNDDNLLVIYALGGGGGENESESETGPESAAGFPPPLPHNADGSIDFSQPCRKAAFIYNLRQNTLLRRLDSVLSVDSNVSRLHTSRNLSVIMDDRFDFHDIVINEIMHRLRLPEGVATDTATLLMDGRYVAVISANRREVLVFRSRDGTQKSRVFVHGRATTMSVGGDDRTLVVGCNDGRVMMLTLVFEHPDPVGELIGALASRKEVRAHSLTVPVLAHVNGTVHQDAGPSNGVAANGVAADGASSCEYNEVLKSDIKNIQITTSQLEQLSEAKRILHEEQRRKPPSFRAVSAGVMLVQDQQRKANSRACVIQ